MTTPEQTLGRARPAGRQRADRLLRLGLAGAAITALCCFTPVLVVLLAGVGLSALTGWLDYVLLPALAVFLGITGIALWRRRN